MRKTANNSSKNTFVIVGIFLAFVSTLLIGSLTYKALSVISKSTFDGTSQFHLRIENEKNRDFLQIVSFSPKKQSIGIAVLNAKKNEAFEDVKVPIDGIVVFESKDMNHSESIQKQLQYLLTHYGQIDSSVTFVDVLRLYWYSQTVPTANVTKQELTLPIEEGQLDAIAMKLFIDDDIVAEKKSIQIINATGKSGVGSRMARLISNMGGNVVDVTTSNTPSSSSRIDYIHEEGYTVRKLSKTLKIPSTVSDKLEISDIVIIVGEESLEKISF